MVQYKRGRRSKLIEKGLFADAFKIYQRGVTCDTAAAVCILKS